MNSPLGPLAFGAAKFNADSHAGPWNIYNWWKLSVSKITDIMPYENEFDCYLIVFWFGSAYVVTNLFENITVTGWIAQYTCNSSLDTYIATNIKFC